MLCLLIILNLLFEEIFAVAYISDSSSVDEECTLTKLCKTISYVLSKTFNEIIILELLNNSARQFLLCLMKSRNILWARGGDTQDPTWSIIRTLFR
jgi:hypothetical protein